ncbi:MAG TPA: hypothetical protein PLV85_03155 [Polyangiaceae bacterium]|nr:hypothetical protein [Polyangiaceae bacterium]
MRPHTSILFLLSMTFLVACGELSSLEAAETNATCPDGCFNADAGTDAPVSDVTADIGHDGVGETATLSNPLCGTLVCDPDDPGALDCYGSGPGIDAGSGIELDAAYEAGEKDDDHGGGKMGGAPPEKPHPPPDNPQDKPQRMSCQVAADGFGQRETTCVAAGTGIDNEPCVSSADCAAGHTCVGDINVGVCRAYCCLNAESCVEGTYCGIMRSRDALTADPESELLLPVCIPASDCELLPGAEGNNRCAEGLMCSVVRSNGTTACVLPGTTMKGEPCGPSDSQKSPCAEGFVCSKTTNTCLALCRVGDPTACGNGVCQSGTGGLPEPYGICVGTRSAP